jgi:squalene-associated FAD-dependent desaturase
VTGRRVLVLGGGLAGLAATVALAQNGFQVRLVEARDRLGGRASSFRDPESGQWLDHCQHVSLGCCTQLAHFCRTVGIDHFLRPQKCLYFLTPDGRQSQLRAEAWPPPWHLARSFAGLHFLDWKDKLHIARALWALQQAAPAEDPPFLEWLHTQGQTPAVIRRFWGLVLVSALNALPEQLGLRYARQVFVEAFFGPRRAWEVYLPQVPLGRLYGQELQRWLQQHNVEVCLRQGVRTLHLAAGRVVGARLRDGRLLTADYYLAAVPWQRLLDLLPDTFRAQEPFFSQLQHLESNPITSIHLWWDRPLTRLPHAALVDCLGQWLFNRGRTSEGSWYVQVVLSALPVVRQLGQEEVLHRIVAEVQQLFPAARTARLLRGRILTEKEATFCPVPGVDRWRPGPRTPLENLFLAGDWTATGWPATMESAVRSGYQAAQALVYRAGRPWPGACAAPGEGPGPIAASSF